MMWSLRCHCQPEQVVHATVHDSFLFCHYTNKWLAASRESAGKSPFSSKSLLLQNIPLFFRQNTINKIIHLYTWLENKSINYLWRDFVTVVKFLSLTHFLHACWERVVCWGTCFVSKPQHCHRSCNHPWVEDDSEKVPVGPVWRMWITSYISSVDECTVWK